MSRVIHREDITEIQPWRVSELEKPRPTTKSIAAKPKATKVEVPTAERLAEIQAQAYQEGFKKGHREGLEASKSEMRACVERFDKLMTTLTKPFEELDLQVEQELLALVAVLTRQLVRRQFKLDPGEIIPVIREAMAALPASARDIRLYLSPEDALLVRESLSLAEEERTWKIVDDPVLTRGDCRVMSDTSQIDARLETRLNALMVSLMGSQRASEQDAS